MDIYTTDYTTGMQAVAADSPAEAAEIFAARIARREYGKTGHVRTRRLSFTNGGGEGSITYYVYDCFIGRSLAGLTGNACDRGTTTGRNIDVAVFKRTIQA